MPYITVRIGHVFRDNDILTSGSSDAAASLLLRTSKPSAPHCITITMYQLQDLSGPITGVFSEFQPPLLVLSLKESAISLWAHLLPSRCLGPWLLVNIVCLIVVLCCLYLSSTGLIF